MSRSPTVRVEARWLVWGILFLPYLVANFHRLAMGVAREALVTEFSLPSAAFANIGAAYFYAYAILQIPAGVLADSIGPRRTVTAGTTVAAFGSVAFGLSGGATALFFSRLAIGVGVSVLFMAILKAVALRFPEGSFASMTGLTAGLGTLGGVFAQTPLYMAIYGYGWRSTFIAVGAVTAILALIVWTLIRDAHPAGHEPGTASGPRAEAPSSPDSAAATGIPQTPSPTGRLPSVRRGLLRALANRRSWPPFIVFFGAYGTFIALSGTWGQAYAIHVLGVGEATASNLLISTVVGITIGGIFCTRISDHLRRRRLPMLLMGGTGVVAWFVFVTFVDAETPIVALYLLFSLLGFCSGISMNTPASAKEVNHPSLSGVSTSIANVGGFVGAAVIPLTMGAVLDSAPTGLAAAEIYRYVFAACIVGSVIAFIGTLFITESNARNIYHTLNRS